MDPSDYQKDPRPPVQSQLSTSLPGVHTYITTTDPKSTVSKVHSKRDGKWQAYDDNKFSMNNVYTQPFSADCSNDEDLADADKLLESGTLRLVREGGTVCRHVDFSPGYQCFMHRTQSIDYGIVVEGTVEMILDDGSVTLMRRGDVAVQRATNHAWRNPSKDEWTRMVFVLSATKPLKVGDKEFGEHGTETV